MTLSKQITLAQALKLKKRLAGQLSKHQEIVRRFNSRVSTGIQPPIPIEEAKITSFALSQALTELKSAITVANGGLPLAEHLVGLAEAKGLLAWLRSISTNTATQEIPVGNNVIKTETIADIKGKDLEDLVQAQENRIAYFQDEIDTINASTRIVVGFSDAVRKFVL